MRVILVILSLGCISCQIVERPKIVAVEKKVERPAESKEERLLETSYVIDKQRTVVVANVTATTEGKPLLTDCSIDSPGVAQKIGEDSVRVLLVYKKVTGQESCDAGIMFFLSATEVSALPMAYENGKISALKENVLLKTPKGKLSCVMLKGKFVKKIGRLKDRYLVEYQADGEKQHCRLGTLTYLDVNSKEDPFFQDLAEQTSEVQQKLDWDKIILARKQKQIDDQQAAKRLLEKLKQTQSQQFESMNP